MSIVIAIGNKRKIILASDGRVTDKNPDGATIILNENYKKIFKVHPGLCVAYAGTMNDCIPALSWISQQRDKITTIEQCTGFLSLWLEQNRDYKSGNVNAQFIVAGVSNNHFLSYITLRYFNGNKEIIYWQLEDGLRYNVCSSLDPADDFISPIMSSGKRIEEMIIECIKTASEKNETINDHIFIETISL